MAIDVFVTIDEADARSKEPKYKPWPFQAEDLPKLIERSWSANWSEMGCLSGDTHIRVMCGSKVRYWTLREAYEGFNHVCADRRRDWKSEKDYFTLSFSDGRIRHNKIEAILSKGEREVVCIKLTDGKEVVLTPDHEILRYDGMWIEAQNLRPGDSVRVLGRKGEKHDSDGRYYKFTHTKNLGKSSVHRIVARTPAGQHTHHIDEDKHNNEEGNLTYMTLSEHSRLHARDQIASYDSPPSIVASVEPAGTVDTYDIVMADPHRNFVANGVVVHNCGKTTSALWLAEAKAKEVVGRGARVLIITTKSGKGTYFQTVPHVLPEWAFCNVQTKDVEWINGGNDPAADRIILAHYHCFTNSSQMRESLEMVKWDLIIVDEAHRIKNYKAQWSKNIKRLKAHNRHVMTGTGFINNPAEIWMLLHFLNRKEFPSYWKFRERYCNEIIVGGFRKIIGIKKNRKAEFQELVRTIGVRRTKSEVFKDLADPIKSVIDVQLSPTQRKMYNDVVRDLKTMDAEGYPITSPNVISALVRLRQIAVATPLVKNVTVDPNTGRRKMEIELTEPSSKIDALMEALESLEWDDERKDSCVIFTQFRDARALIAKRLDKAHISYIALAQSDSDTARNEKVAAFQRQEAQVFLTTLGLGSESITLTAASTAFMVDRSWSPATNAQAEARIHRPGQTGVAHIVSINAVSTVDQRIDKANATKTSWFIEIFGQLEGI